MFRKKTISPVVLLLALCGLQLSCTDAVTPEFQFEEGLIFVESIASTSTKASFVTIKSSAIEFGVYVVNFVEEASVEFENVATGEVVALIENRNSYIPPDDFVVRSGETWKLNIQLPNGKKIESLPESVLDVVPIDNIAVRYDPELTFREIYGGRFVPGHQVSINFSDPPDSENYYYWTYKSFENLDYCEQCVESIWRNGECTPVEIARFRSRYFDYACDIDCWRIRFPESVAIYDDRFSNGSAVTELPVGDLLLHTKENMVVEVQQFSITPAAYQYYKVLKDIVDNSSGLNAPPPAALIGNLSNPDNAEDFVFGRFTAAATSTATAFINRSLIAEQPLEFRNPIILEPQIASPYPPPATVIAPCSENRERTSNEPDGWQEE
ncbi:MAG: DUF4249 domain-containing protein [Maribacter sp.]|uniref:DUF4249 domain-containing protein n=1 Tax=Maribacter sp. TaxID=1897614 RepID=UPI003299528E